MPSKGDMPLRCPALIIHHQAGKEYWAEQEVGDTLFPQDPNVEIKATQYRGVLLVYTELQPLEAYRLLRNQILTSIDRIIPIHKCIKVHDYQRHAIEWLCRELKELVGMPPCFRLHVNLRGKLKQHVTLRDLESCVGTRSDRGCRNTVYIGSLEDLLYIGMAPA